MACCPFWIGIGRRRVVKFAVSDPGTSDCVDVGAPTDEQCRSYFGSDVSIIQHVPSMSAPDEHLGEQCRHDTSIEYVPPTNASSNDIDIYNPSDADVSINPGVMIKADQVIVDLETKQLETAARGCPLGATTSERQTCHVDDDDEDINDNVVLDPGILDASIIHRSTSWISRLRTLKRPGFGSLCLH